MLIGPAIAISSVAALIMWFESGWSPILSQSRVGRDGKLFRLLKIRTMSLGTPHVASHEIGAKQITPVGAILRRTKLDELPQVWNVLVGDMSFVGPRPCLPTQTELIHERQRRGVQRLRPGITGVAQVRGLDMSDPVGLAAVDAEYLGAWRLSRDLRCLFATVRGGGRGDAVTRGGQR